MNEKDLDLLSKDPDTADTDIANTSSPKETIKDVQEV